MSYSEQMAARTLAAGAKVLFAKIVDNENDAAARLSLPPHSGIIKLERLRHASGEPFALEPAISAPPNFPACLNRPSSANRFLAFSSAITKWIWAMTKKSTPPPPIRASPSFSPSRAANRYCAFARSFIQRGAMPSCTCWVFIAPTGTIW